MRFSKRANDKLLWTLPNNNFPLHFAVQFHQFRLFQFVQTNENILIWQQPCNCCIFNATFRPFFGISRKTFAEWQGKRGQHQTKIVRKMRSQIFRLIVQKFRRHTLCMSRDLCAIWRKICKQITCKAARRSLFGAALWTGGDGSEVKSRLAHLRTCTQMLRWDHKLACAHIFKACLCDVISAQ